MSWGCAGVGPTGQLGSLSSQGDGRDLEMESQGVAIVRGWRLSVTCFVLPLPVYQGCSRSGGARQREVRGTDGVFA